MSSSSEAPPPRFERGEEVILKATARSGVVMQAHWIESEWHYDVFFGEPAPQTFPERHLAPAGGNSLLDLLKRWQFADVDEFRHALVALKLRRPLQQNLYSFLASRTDLQPYQFKPVLKLLQSPYGRMFIADEVGLGKTIEAGIILAELAARGKMDRVLVCCPPALRHKWKSEMRERFDQDFEILRGAELRERFATPESRMAPLKAISSLHALRDEDIVANIAEADIRFDLVVVDESHHMQNPETASYALGEQLASAADFMLMLSATPLSLSTSNLFYQLHILAPEEFFDVHEFDASIEPNTHLNSAMSALARRPPEVQGALDELKEIGHLQHGHRFTSNPLYRDVRRALERLDGDLPAEKSLELRERLNELNTIGHIFTRTRKREVQEHFPSRRAHTIEVELNPAEAEFYDAVTEFVRHSVNGHASFALIMPQRQVASSIPAAREYLAERFGFERTYVEEDAAAELDVPEGEELEQLDPSERLQKAWQAAEGVDSKFDRFWEALEGMAEERTAADGKILVFSFFRKTIEHLARRLRGRSFGGEPLRVSILYGPTPPEDRRAIVDAFRNEGGPHIVLSSEVAAEGLDFEFANVMVNYDLPWNPMRVEQRIGRLDRYGQTAKVIHIFNFSVLDTIEQRILQRLYERIGIFRAAIGDLESILGNTISELTRELFRPDLTPDEADRFIDQTAENILRRQRDAERFEEESRALLGQDDIFTEQLDRLREERRYIGPEDIRGFVTVALRKEVPRARIRDAADGVTEIHVPQTGGVHELMNDFLRRSGEKGATSAWRAVDRSLPGATWRVTFDPETAKRHRELDFLTLRHPLVGALLQQQPEDRALCTSVRIEEADGQAGTFVFFLFLLNIRGFKSGLELLPVAVAVDGDVDEALSARVLSEMRAATSFPNAQPSEDEVQAASDKAAAWVVRHVAERERELRRTSDTLIDRRIASLRETHARLVQHRRVRLDEDRRLGRDRLVRMHEGFIRNRDRELREKLADLEARRGVAIGREAVAGGILHVGPPA
jgi:SNF2 family DNA or RNA helicase